MRLEIDLPELPKGCDRVQWGRPKLGDWYLYSRVDYATGEVVHKWLQFAGQRADYIAIVARPIWTPPAGWSQIYSGWLTRDDNGDVCIHEQEPAYDKPGEQWYSSGQILNLYLIRPEMQIPADIPADKCCFYLGDQ
jgi:hypothetical protein